MLSNIRIVLVETSHPGNIGAAARAMKNMCLERLYLVNPELFPHAEASARASGADDLLAQARVCASLEEALIGCHWVVGTSARRRGIPWPLLDPRQCGERALAEAGQGEVALVFGRERTGLTNAELDHCQYLVQIPSNPDFSSLNLGQAVQVLCYEVYSHHLARGEPAPAGERKGWPPATQEAMEGFFGHLEQTLEDIGFIGDRSAVKLMRRLRSFFNRARPDRKELEILRGILSHAQGGKSMRQR
jgi:tRNA (cytidine32/uridine32-2'-O)-methyltransferase